jgi:hypothetical protein
MPLARRAQSALSVKRDGVHLPVLASLAHRHLAAHLVVSRSITLHLAITLGTYTWHLHLAQGCEVTPRLQPPRKSCAFILAVRSYNICRLSSLRGGNHISRHACRASRSLIESPRSMFAVYLDLSLLFGHLMLRGLRVIPSTVALFVPRDKSCTCVACRVPWGDRITGVAQSASASRARGLARA